MTDLAKLALNGLDPSILPPAILGRLSFSPAAPNQEPLPPGQHLLGVAAERDAVLYVPAGLAPDVPAPLFVMFHGANGSAENILPFFKRQAEKHRFLLLLPQSTYHTWDLVIGGNGPDLACLEQSLAAVSARFTLSRHRLAFAGFSDGASYALSIGLTNGSLLSHILAFSGGFMNVYQAEGKPQIFLAHSPQDQQLPIDKSGRRHARTLREAGYDVEYVEFDGEHVIHPPVVEQAMVFFLKVPGPAAAPV